MYQKLHTQYPCLKQGKYGGIVLFTAPETGTKLTNPIKKIPKNVKNVSNDPIGTVRDDWDEKSFTPYNEPVTLQN